MITIFCACGEKHEIPNYNVTLFCRECGKPLITQNDDEVWVDWKQFK